MLYGIPVAILQRLISSREFTELRAYSEKNTLQPDIWWASATSTSILFQAITGEFVDPRFMVPGQIDHEQWKAAQERAAEKSMNAKASKK